MFKFYNFVENKEMDLPICKDYVEISSKGDMLSFMISKGIVISNIVLRLIVI